MAAGSSLDLEKFPDNLRKSNLKSTWALLLSVFACVSLFYAFNLSPTPLLSTTKFWFVISNTLVLIIATDFGAFSETTKADDLYVENNAVVRHAGRGYSTVPSCQIVPYSEDETVLNQVYEEPREKIMDDMVVVSDSDRVIETEQVLEICEQQDLIVNNDNGSVRADKRDDLVVDIINKEQKRDEHDEPEDKMVLQTTLSDQRREHDEDDDDEYSNMSDEELNRRVEEFIRWFNRQIRLQAAGQNF